MPTLLPDEIARHISELLRRPSPVLFAGAGVGVRVGFPSWDGYIEHLAATCERFGDTGSADLIRSRLKQGNHLGAAAVFKTSTAIPEGEIWRSLSEPFARAVPDAELDKLVPLVGLPFSALVTTNYEHSLHDACAKVHGRWVEPVERGTLGRASLNRSFFVARIHGSAESPTSMVVDAGDYRLLDTDDDYLDFLLNLLSARTCLFLGFSFLDPAIRHVLDVYAAKFGPAYPALHLAVVPGDDQQLSSRLRQLNIQTLAYDPINQHGELWRALRLAYDAHRTGAVVRPRGAITASLGHGAVHRFVAFAFAQTRLRPEADPLSALAQDGLVASVVASQDKGVATEDVVVKNVASALKLTVEQAQRVVSQSLDRLAAKEQVLRDGPTVAFVGAGDKELEQQLGRLTRDVLDRMPVRDGVRGTDSDARAAAKVIEIVLMSRAWDIGAHYAGGNSGWAPDVRQLVRDAMLEVASEHRPSAPEALENAIHALITAPDDQEAELLTSLGRAAFGIQLLLASPRQALFHRHALPRSLYLDASVLMPAITTGHPLKPAYMDVIRRMSEAAAKARSPLTVSVGYQFLNEIVSHRKAAFELVVDAKLEDVDNLRRHIQLHTALNTNVFVGAYGSVVGRSGTRISFAEFMATAAPFTTEDQLAAHLEGLGVASVRMDFRTDHNSEYIAILNPLKDGYEGIGAIKPGVLVEHEAQQLTQLVVDAQNGVSSLFVTADGRLRRILSDQPALKTLSGMTVSHLGLVALADVMVGLDADARSLARLVWASPVTNEEKALFDYFVNLGLQRYDEGLSGELHNLAQKSAAEAKALADAEHVKIFGDSPDDVARSAAFMDRFEKRFYENWNAAILRRQSTGD